MALEMDAKPLITIGLPVFNAQRTLAEAISSILAQSYSDWELLLMDDGSTDETERVASSFKDARIHWVSDGLNRGISYRLNQAVAMAKGDYFCRMDADDVCFPHRFQVQVDALLADQQVDLVAAAVLTFSSDGVARGVVPIASSHTEICARPWNGFHFPHPTWMGRIDWFRARDYSTAANGAEDQLMLYQRFATSRFAGINQVLLAYRDDRSSFGKLVGRRMKFWRAIAGAALSMGRWRDGLLVCLRQPLKILADFLYVYGGIVGARNQLVPVEAPLQHAWEELKALVHWDGRANP
jgi:glycosyltransferase involved in cell wall biosynthesis